MNRRPSARNSRLDAARILIDWKRDGHIPLQEMTAEGSDSRMVLKLVYGVIRHDRTLQWVIAQTIRDRPMPNVRTVLSLGLYQVLFAEDVADHAAVHETVNAAAAVCGERSVGLVNAVLRRVQEERKWWLLRVAEQPAPVRYSLPDILPERWRKAYGVKGMHAICEWNNQPAQTYVHRLSSRCRASEFEQAWKDAEISYTSLGRKHPGFYSLGHGHRIVDLPGFREGWFQVQDPATYAAIDLLDLRPGMTVLDACAAPGGKTLAIADRMKGKGQILAVEFSARRITRMEENFKRVPFESISIQEADFTQWNPQADQPQLFDRILIDAPCSNTGVIRRKPDIRWRFDEDAMERLTILQTRLLDHAAQWVSDDGLIVYSTCSLEEEENETLINRWLRDNPDWKLARSEKRNPFISETDGAYAAQLRKVPHAG